MVDYIQGVILVLFEALICSAFLSSFLQRKPREIRWQMLEVASLAGLYLISAATTYYSKSLLIRGGGQVLAVILVAVIFYQCKLVHVLVLDLAFYGIMIAVDGGGIVISEALFRRNLLENPMFQVMISLLFKMVTLVIVVMIRYIWSRKKHVMEMQRVEWIMLFLFPLMTVCIMIILMTSYGNGTMLAGYVGISLGMIVVDSVLFVLLSYISDRERKLRLLQLQQTRAQERLKMYQELNVTNTYHKKILHDYSNQLHCIQGLMADQQYEKAKEYAQKLTNDLCQGSDFIDVHNTIVNVVLNQKYRLATQKGIKIIFDIMDFSEIKLDDQDVVILLSNLLDNAIEATAKETAHKVIKIKLLNKNDTVIISISNRISKPVKIVNGMIQTSKSDKENHGIGLNNIMTIVKKYDGDARMRYKDGWFYYTAIL